MVVVAVGCASTSTNREQVVTGKLPRPAHIWVYNFVATPGNVPSDSALTDEFDLYDAPQTAENVALGQQLGSEIAADLVEQIRGMGLPGERAWTGMTPEINDIVIRGYLLSIDEGSASKRVAIGLGSGVSELRTAVEGFQVTAQGPRKLGSGTVDSGGGKSPGAAVGGATFLATANPAGLIISSGMKVYGEKSGKSTVEGRAKQTAQEIGDVLAIRFKEAGWIN
jgi:hypothetical protein